MVRDTITLGDVEEAVALAREAEPLREVMVDETSDASLAYDPATDLFIVTIGNTYNDTPDGAEAVGWYNAGRFPDDEWD